MTWPLVVLILGILAMAVARDVFLRLYKQRDESELDRRLASLESLARAREEDIDRLNAVVRDQTNRLNLNRRRTG